MENAAVNTNTRALAGERSLHQEHHLNLPGLGFALLSHKARQDIFCQHPSVTDAGVGCDGALLPATTAGPRLVMG